MPDETTPNQSLLSVKRWSIALLITLDPVAPFMMGLGVHSNSYYLLLMMAIITIITLILIFIPYFRAYSKVNKQVIQVFEKKTKRYFIGGLFLTVLPASGLMEYWVAFVVCMGIGAGFVLYASFKIWRIEVKL